jgi:hypothetical protein
MILIGVILVVCYGYMLSRKNSIEFAIWVVQTSCKVLNEHGGMIRFAFLWMILQALMFVTYIVFSIAGAVKYGAFVLIYLMFSLF